MKLNTLLIPVTFGAIIFAAVTVFNHVRKDMAFTEEAAEPTSGQTTLPSSERSLLSESRSLLVTGITLNIPKADDYLLLHTVPWKLSDVSKSFREASVERSCELLEVGSTVIQPLLDVKPDVAGPLGRRCAFSIQLQLGKDSGSNLPNLTRGIIEDYLKAHQLTIQPSYYYDEKARLILSPKIRASFIRLDAPKQATVAEPMIAKSIEELRTLGAYWNKSTPFTPADCRTLILGFRYTLDSPPIAGKANARLDYELLFIHVLPQSTPQSPKVAVFATSDARTQFHLLEESDPESEMQSAAITADVRFADSKMMGMYPERPVVTRVYHKALLSVPVELVQSEIEGLTGVPPEGGFSGVLDKLYKTATGTDLSAEGVTSENQPSDDKPSEQLFPDAPPAN
jgi:hypothetical protein